MTRLFHNIGVKTRSWIFLLCLLGGLLTQQASAGFSNNTSIIAIDVRSNGTYLIDVSQPAVSSPSCVTSQNPEVNTRFSGTTTTDGGKAMLQFAEAAYLSGVKVSVEGLNACNEYGGIESLFRVYASR